MFDLVYRDGAPSNTGYYKEFPAYATEELKCGQVVWQQPEIVTKIGPTVASKKAIGIVAHDKPVGEDRVLLLMLADDMYFEAPIEGTEEEKAALIHGYRLTYSSNSDGVTATRSTDSNNHCPIFIERRGKDKVLVRFDNCHCADVP